MLPLRFVSQLPVKRLLLRLTHMTAWSELLLSDSSCKKPGRFSNSDSPFVNNLPTGHIKVCHLPPRHVLGTSSACPRPWHLASPLWTTHPHLCLIVLKACVPQLSLLTTTSWFSPGSSCHDRNRWNDDGGRICPSSEMTVWREVKHVGSPSAGVSRWHLCGWTWGHYVGHRLVLVLANMWIRGNGVKHCEPHSRVVVID